MSRSTRCARRSRTSSSGRWRARTSRFGVGKNQERDPGPSAPLAVSVFRESVRDKVLYNLVAFAVLLMAASYLIGQLTAGQDIKIIKDLGLAAIATFGLMIAVFIGIGLVWKEVERRSIYSLLSKPLSRAEFILGKGLRPRVDPGGQRRRDGHGLVHRARLHGHHARPKVRAAWPAPRHPTSACSAGRGPHPRRADAGDGDRAVLLDLSSLFLSAGLTLGLWVIGHFNADLKNFEAVVDSRRGRLVRARALLRAAELLCVRHQAAGGLRTGSARELSRHDGARYGAPSYIAAPARGLGGGCSHGATSSSHAPNASPPCPKTVLNVMLMKGVGPSVFRHCAKRGGELPTGGADRPCS